MQRRLRVLLFLLISCFYLVPAGRCQSPEEISYSPAASAEEKCFLWKVRSQSSVVYLAGSIHLAKPELYPLNPNFEQAFNEAEILVVEVNINESKEEELQKLMLEKGLYPSGDTIEEHISSSTYELADLKLKEMGLELTEIDYYKPWLVALSMSVLELQRLGFDPAYGIDQYFLNRAAGQKEILELENFDFQIELFNSFSEDEQELLLFYTIKDLDTVEQDMDKLVDAWVLGDADSLEALVFKNLIEYPQTQPIYEKLIYERNENMAAKIEQFLNTDKVYFVVVGSAHLVGGKGIIKLLEEKGYLVEQL